ncbi:MAG: UDP-N-acetylmuramoyl-tripeptide--D-alanyl-D-alanine ligase [Limnohabitans sp.]
MNLSLKQASHWLSGARAERADGVTVQRVHTDSRTLQPGELFVALRGERFDASQFIEQAAVQGATAVLCEASGQAAASAAGLPALIVADSRIALGELAAGWRAQFGLPLIAVTGSNGKTTVTQMVASILRAHAGDATHATRGNLNNDIGVPLTLLALRPHHRIAVVELGMNHPGEIAYLAKLAQPTVALVNNAQREHQEFMHTVRAVAEENGAVLQFLPAQGVAVYPQDDEYTSLWDQLADGRARCRFALASGDVHASAVLWHAGVWQFTLRTPQGTAPVSLHIAGRHNVKNALAAAACALSAGVPLSAVAQGLQAFEPVKGRSRALSLDAGRISLVDDTYNANPDSVKAAIDVLAELPGPRLLVLGDMGEVGDQGPQYHAEVGAYAARQGIDALLTIGELSVHAHHAFGAARGQHFADMSMLLAAVSAMWRSAASILVKGSRFMKMERVVEGLQEQDIQKGEAHAA